MPCDFVESDSGSDDFGGGYAGGGGSGGSAVAYQDTIIVDSGSTHTASVGSDESFTNKFIDRTSSNSSSTVTASGGGWQVSNVVTAGDNNGQNAISAEVPNKTDDDGLIGNSLVANDDSPDDPPERPAPNTYVPFDSNDYKDVLGSSKTNLNTIVSSPAVSNNAVEVLIPAGEHGGSSMWADLSAWDGSLPEEAWSRHYVRFGPDFYVEQAGKLPGFAHLTGDGTGGGNLADGTNGWSARGGFNTPESGGDLRLGTYLYHAKMDGPYGDMFLWDGDGELVTQQWYRIDQYCRMNTPGESNGVYRGWVDGNLSFDKRDIKYRDKGYDNLRIGHFWLHLYYGGSPTPDHDVRIYLDELEVSRSRIGSDLEAP